MSEQVFDHTSEAIGLDAPPSVIPPSPLPDRIRLTQTQCRVFLALLERKHCRVVMLPDSNNRLPNPAYIANPPNGYTLAESEAERVTVGHVVANYTNCLLIELIDQDLAEQIKAKRCLASSMLHAVTVKLLKVAPLNATARASAMQQLSRALPDEADNWDKIAEWIEANIWHPDLDPDPQIKEAAPPTPARAWNIALGFAINFSDVETGRCDYSVRRHANETQEFTEQEIHDLLEEYPDETLEELTNLLREKAMDYPWGNLNPEMDSDWEDCEYNDHESEGTRSKDTEFQHGRETHMRMVAEVLRRMLTPEQLRQRGINP